MPDSIATYDSSIHKAPTQVNNELIHMKRITTIIICEINKQYSSFLNSLINQPRHFIINIHLYFSFSSQLSWIFYTTENSRFSLCHPYTSTKSLRRHYSASHYLAPFPKHITLIVFTMICKSRIIDKFLI
jgi:hypothetical protein